eukprot:TRINITY_DN6541_c0_g1_i1.p1 TRINITY_DN6541_c0_g1~~TRINITY_DN6541_c0_g1_i1.p1  ORF type:complete len:144 (-),score=39.08 TRINITY_DN6541_c0_g1_i1:488-919(-)
MSTIVLNPVSSLTETSSIKVLNTTQTTQTAFKMTTDISTANGNATAATSGPVSEGLQINFGKTKRRAKKATEEPATAESNAEPDYSYKQLLQNIYSQLPSTSSPSTEETKEKEKVRVPGPQLMKNGIKTTWCNFQVTSSSLKS